MAFGVHYGWPLLSPTDARGSSDCCSHGPSHIDSGNDSGTGLRTSVEVHKLRHGVGSRRRIVRPYIFFRLTRFLATFCSVCSFISDLSGLIHVFLRSCSSVLGMFGISALHHFVGPVSPYHCMPLFIFVTFWQRLPTVDVPTPSNVTNRLSTMPFLIGIAVLFLHSLIPFALADDGMDMSMDGAMALASGSMLPYLHFSRGDTVWFLGWVPESKGAMVGTCIGLFLLALVDRWLSAMRAIADSHWRIRGLTVMTNKLNAQCDKEGARKSKSTLITVLRRRIPPFIIAHDIARGILHAAQMALTFAFMLVVMTYQAAFIISIVIGLGVGETLFGRYGSAVSNH